MMTPQHDLTGVLAQMPSLQELFSLFLSGKHLNRMSEPALWAELEQQQETYRELFRALGFDLRIDNRGFAWFYQSHADSKMNDNSRHSALLFMLIFDAQANAGKALQRFTDWKIDRVLLDEIYRQQKDLLDAENIDMDRLEGLLQRLCDFGFVAKDTGGWRLLPSVYRYLDHFEDLAQADINSSETETQEIYEEYDIGLDVD